MCGRTSQYAHPIRADQATTALRQHRRVMEALGLDYTKSATALLERLRTAQQGAATAAALDFVGAMEPPLPLPQQERPLKAGARTTFKRSLATSFTQQEHAESLAAETLAQSSSSSSSASTSSKEGSLRASLPDDSESLEICRYGADSKIPVQVGDLLITHPLSCISQEVLDQAVVLIDDIDMEIGYVRGVVLNKAGNKSLGDILERWGRTEDEDRAKHRRLEALLEKQARVGGDIFCESMWDSVTMVHSLGAELPDSKEVAPGLWIGGDLDEASSMLRHGSVPSSSLRLCLGFAGWSLQQLQIELQKGVWIRVRPGDARATQKICLPEDAAWETAAASRAEGTSQSWWRGALNAAGLPSLADFPRSEYADEELRQMLESHQEEVTEDIMRSLKWSASESHTDELGSLQEEAGACSDSDGPSADLFALTSTSSSPSRAYGLVDSAGTSGSSVGGSSVDSFFEHLSAEDTVLAPTLAVECERYEPPPPKLKRFSGKPQQTSANTQRRQTYSAPRTPRRNGGGRGRY